MVPDNPRGFSKIDLETLQHLANLLHLFHHRNKNQHRRSIWWRHFLTFRRQLNSLISEIESLHEVPTTHLQRSRKKVQDKDIKERILHRLEFWREVTVAKWYDAFSQVVADGRFAVLGLVLLAALAQVCHVASIEFDADEFQLADADEVLQDFAEAAAGTIGDRDTASATGIEDVGEVIRRDEMVDNASKDNLPQETIVAKKDVTDGQPKTNAAPPAPPRKKRRKGNAIDDLFSGLA